MITRRMLLELSLYAPVLSSLSNSVFADSKVNSAITYSDLIYLSPIKSDGNESSCQAEIWFVQKGHDMYVVTSTRSWRTRAVVKGLNRARVWVGDLGSWKSTDGKYKELPSLEVEASLVSDDTVIQEAIELFGDKYPLGWVVYESRFRKGLADGTRSMLRYSPLAS